MELGVLEMDLPVASTFVWGWSTALICQARLHIMQKEEFNSKQMHVDKNQCFHNLHLWRQQHLEQLKRHIFSFLFSSVNPGL